MTSSAMCDERVPDLAEEPADVARSLVASLVAQPAGQVSPSVYETARLVALAPWLDGHDARLRFLQTSQRSHGGWGHDDGYGLVPTLSATDAILTALRRGDARPSLRPVANRGLSALRRWLTGPTRLTLPDTPGIEILVPALVESLNQQLVGARLPRGPRLPMPEGADPDTLAAFRSAAAVGAELPAKLLHSLEALAPLPRSARSLRPRPRWTVGASPAATAAWLGGVDPDGAAGIQPRGGRATALRYLRDVVGRYGGPVPSVIPITAFERAWVLSTLADAGLAVPVAASGRLIRQLAAGIGESGTSGGPGLPPDADTTSVALLALEQHGLEPDLDCLLGYEAATHFQTWTGERTPSVSTNAHVLDILTMRLCRVPQLTGRYGRARERIVAWLRDQQAPDGSWSDKWHASPYYATAACVIALTRCADVAAEPAVRRLVDRAVRWVLGSQREDGGWGRWDSTAEESAYAVRVLWSRRQQRPTVRAAAERAHGYLAANPDRRGTALWHDKELYRPDAVVRATVLAARHLLERGSPIPRQRRPTH